LLDPRYAYISAYLKAEEPNIVSSRHIDRMLGTSNVRDAQAIIRRTDIGNYLEGVSYNNFNDLDRSLWRYFVLCIQKIEAFKFLPGDMTKLSRVYIEKYDVLNIKAAAQALGKVGSQDPMIPAGTVYNNGLLDALSCAENIAEIIELLTQNRLGRYIPILEDYEPDEGTKARLILGASLDGEYFKAMLGLSNRIKDGSVMAQATGVVIDITNLQIAARAIIANIGTDIADYIIPGGYLLTDKTIRELLTVKISDLPRRLEDSNYHGVARELANSYDKTKSITSVNEVLETYKYRSLRDILSPTVLSPLVMAWYLVLKETEIRNLRIIFRALYNNISTEEIKRFLVF
jgi:vacuolar-type H+-ATPase subunit C/Vma6